VAIGAAIENMKIGAPSLGKTLSVELFPEKEDQEFVAKIVVADQQQVATDPLVDAIEQRVTNRKQYKKYALTDTEITSLMNAITPEEAILSFTTDSEKMKQIAKAGSTNERIMLGNSSLHDYFFSHVNWTEEEDYTKKEGFFIKSLELPPPAVLGFKAMSSWRRASVLNRYLHFNELVQTQNAKVYEGSSGMGVISTRGDSPKEAVQAGMAMERIWLTATSFGLAFQPLAGIMYLKLGIDNAHSSAFNDFEMNLITEAYELLRSTFELGDRQVYFAFRVGKADAPTARARRYTVEDVTGSNA
jgi:hypothetical protein